jgi:hypothetical protein
MTDPERPARSEYIKPPEKWQFCETRYTEWTYDLISISSAEGPTPRFVTQEFWNDLTTGVDPVIKEVVRQTDSIDERINSKNSPSKRNAEREVIIAEVLGRDPFSGIKDESVVRRVRGVTINIMVALQRGENGADVFNDEFTPRAWHYVKDNVIRNLIDVKSLDERLKTEKGDKLSSVSPMELAYAVQLLTN